MRILTAHNYYLEPGGEDQVFRSEAHLLEDRGHTVLEHSVDNRRAAGMSRLQIAASAVWNRSSGRVLRSLMAAHRPEVVHFHNTFPLLSPSCYGAAREGGAAVVQTLHNYRLLCPGALLERSGSPCEACVGRPLAWPGILHGCYRSSRAATAALAGMTAAHRAAGTWSHAVDVYVALTRFARARFVEGGLPAAKIVVKPNFVWPDPGRGAGSGGYALFAGRMSEEKGVATLAAAWTLLDGALPLKAAGDGPLAGTLTGVPGIEWLGRRTREDVLGLMQEASFLVFPSLCYEGLPMAVLEAFACGLPVIASRRGAMAEVVEDGRTGLLFRPSDAGDLAATVAWAASHPTELSRMRREARAEFESRYTAGLNYQALIEIYERARSSRS
ncbi:MAG TPA: glycosyltransferase [Bryobacteraceae bacterium]|nr:glycosyltransferase [Bryobacteraceae bacterium]